MLNNLHHYPYSSQRTLSLGTRWAAATSQPLATLAGLEMFWAGGNAVDAALAMAIALTVVEPTSNGIGGDAFALVWDGQLHGLNGSGKSPRHLTLEPFAGLTQVPRLGWLTVTVPGAVSAWFKLWQRWGKLPFEELFAPAIRYAEEGFAVSPVTAAAWQREEELYLSATGEEFLPFQEVFFPRGRAPQAGEIWQSPLHGGTLRHIAASGGESFYRGELASRMVDFAQKTGGYLEEEDLAGHEAEWVEPIATTYRHLKVWEIPPNTQGLTALLALNILEGWEINQYPRDSAESYHLQVEAMKLAFADAQRYLADPETMEVTAGQLLAKDYAYQRRRLIGQEAIPLAEPGFPQGGTVYLATADGDLMVSLIQSNYEQFGSGILIPETGIALQNRGSCFALQPAHPNQVAPGKRPFHTIIPGFLSQGEEPLGPFGVMGGQMQPQGHVQVVVNLADYQLNPQAALDAPRWRFLSGKQLLLEEAVPEEVGLGLQSLGHEVERTQKRELFGKGQIILRRGDVLVAASEPRADGLAIAG